jgi:hypothetical protein
MNVYLIYLHDVDDELELDDDDAITNDNNKMIITINK